MSEREGGGKREREKERHTNRASYGSICHTLPIRPSLSASPHTPPPTPTASTPPPPPPPPSVVTSEPQCLRTETAACFFVDVLFRTLYLRYLCSHSTCFYSIFAAISARKRAQRSLMKLVDNNAWNSAWLMLLAFPWESARISQSCPSKKKKRKQKLKKAERK